MSDNSPCFPLPSRTFHQPTFHYPNGSLRPIRTVSIDGSHHSQLQKAFMRERFPTTGTLDVVPKGILTFSLWKVLDYTLSASL